MEKIESVRDHYLKFLHKFWAIGQRILYNWTSGQLDNWTTGLLGNNIDNN